MASKAASSKVVEDRRPIRRDQGFAEEVFDILRSDIVSLRIPPDTRISIDNLARELGVSQTPIREALRQLEAMGLVTKQHYVGYCSAPKLTRRQFDELYEMRLQLEPYAARRAAERLDDDQLEELRKLAGEDVSRQAFDLFAEQDARLHDIIAKGSGNSLIQDTLGRLHLHFHIFRLRLPSVVITKAQGEHGELVKALIARDAAGAEEAMREHIQGSYLRLAAFAENDFAETELAS